MPESPEVRPSSQDIQDNPQIIEVRDVDGNTSEEESEPDVSVAITTVTTDEEESDFDDENHMTIRAKWMLDSCETIDDIVERLHYEIANFLRLKEEGWELTSSIDDDWGFMRRNVNANIR